MDPNPKEEKSPRFFKAGLLFAALQGGAFGSLLVEYQTVFGHLMYIFPMVLAGLSLGFFASFYLYRIGNRLYLHSLLCLLISVLSFLPPHPSLMLLCPFLVGALNPLPARVLPLFVWLAFCALGFLFPQTLYGVLLLPLLSKHVPSTPSSPLSWTKRIDSLGNGLGLGFLILIVLVYQWPLLQPQPNDMLWYTGLVILGFGLRTARSSALSPSVLLLSIAALWFFLGPLSVNLQPTDPNILFVVLFGSGLVLLSAMTFFASNASFLFLGLALALMSIWLLSTDYNFLIPLVGVCALLLVFQEDLRNKTLNILTLSFLFFLFFTNRSPTLAHSPPSLFAPPKESSNMAIIDSYWDRNGWFFLTRQTADLSLNVTDAPQTNLLIENIDVSEQIPQNNTELDFGLTIGYLSENMGQVLLLNDISGKVAATLLNRPIDLLQISISSPEFLRKQAELFPERKSIWLRPNVLLRPLHSEELLRTVAPQDLIIEVVHLPFPSLISGTYDSAHFQTVADQLSDSGMAAFVIHLTTIPEYAFLPLANHIEQCFSHVQYWLPQNNADSVLVLAKQRPFSWNQLKSRLLEENVDIYQLAGRAFSHHLPTASTITRPNQRNQPHTPVLHLGPLASSVSAPQQIWMDISTSDASLLDLELKKRTRYLEILQDAASGKMESVFQRVSSELNNSPDMVNSLIKPHLSSAKAEIRKAQQEGQRSAHWQEAHKYALTAQMLSPKSVEPLLLLGEIAIGEGLIDTAEKRYAQALELAPTDLSSLHGMARVFGLQQDFTRTEEYLLQGRETNPNRWIAHHNLGVFYLQQGKIQPAEEILRKALSFDSPNAVLTRVALTEVYIASSEFTRALAEIDRALLEKDQAYSWFLRGRIHFELEQWDKAEGDFRRATLNDPSLHAARGSIGLVKIALGDLEGAAQAFRATLRFDPNNSIALQNLRRVEQELGQ